MNKAELITTVSEKSGVNKKDSTAVLDALIESITEALKAKDKVALVGFGTFETQEREAGDPCLCAAHHHGGQARRGCGVFSWREDFCGARARRRDHCCVIHQFSETPATFRHWPGAGAEGCRH